MFNLTVQQIFTIGCALVMVGDLGFVAIGFMLGRATIDN